MPLVSIKEYARHKGVSDTSIHKMIKAGRIPEDCIDRSGVWAKIDKLKADTALRRNTNPALLRKTRTGKTSLSLLKAPKNPKQERAAEIASTIKLDQQGKPIPEDDEDEATGPEVDLSQDPKNLYEAREHEAIWKAIKMKMEAQKMRRELISVDEANLLMGDLGVKLRMALLDIPDRIAPDCHAAITTFEIRDIMYKAIEDQLLRVSKLNIE